jgi:alkaline phosphatase D
MANAFTDQPTPSFNDTTLAAVFSGASWTPPDGAIVIVFVGNSKASAPNLPDSLTGNGQTWTQVATVTFNTAASPTRRLTAYRSLIVSPSAGALTVTFPSNQTGCFANVVSITGSKTTGTNGADAIVQAVTNYADTGDDRAFVVLADFLNHSNSVLAGFGVDGTVTLVQQSGFTLGTQQAYITPTHTGNAEWKVAPDALATVTWSTASKWGGIALEIAAATPDASNTSIARGPFVGGVTATTAKFLTVLDSGGDFTLKYGTDPALTGATEVATSANASTGFTRMTSVTGLTAGTRYYYQAVGDAASSAIHTFKTLPTAPTTLRVVCFSDFHDMDASPSEPPGTAFVSGDAEVPDLVWIGGDFDHGNPGTGADPIAARTAFRAMWNRLLDGNAYGGPPYSMPDFVASILRKYPTFHTWDDHDYRSNNANKTYPWKDVVSKAEFKRFYPSYTLPSIAGGIWQKFACGTLAEFFVLDTRSQRDLNTDTDNASKSMLDGDALGATGQKQWLKDGLAASGATWKIIMTQVPWNPTALKTNPETDNWCGFTTEQDELIAYIQANGIAGVVFVSGDVHMGALDDGTSAVFPEVIVPPPNFIGEGFNNLDTVGTWSGGIWENNGYVLLEVAPSRLALSVKDVNGVTQRSMFLQAAGSVVVQPNTGRLVLYRDSPSATALRGELTLAGFAPTLIRGTILTPGVGALAATGAAPSVSQSGGVALTPGAGGLIVSGVAPTLEVDTRLTVASGSLLLTGEAPTIGGVTQITPGAGTLVLTGQLPTIGGAVQIVPGTGLLTLAGFEPRQDRGLFPGTGILTLGELAPFRLSDTRVTPAVGSLLLSGIAPSRLIDLRLTPSVGTLLLSGQLPQLGGAVQITPSAGALVLAGLAPLVGGDVQIVPGSGLLSLLGATPAQGSGLSPSAGALTLGGLLPGLLTDVRLTPSVAALVLSGQIPLLNGAVQIVPGTALLTLTGLNPLLAVPSPRFILQAAARVYTLQAAARVYRLSAEHEADPGS